MAYEEALKCISLPVAADYSADQWTFMDVNTSGQAVQVSSAGGRAIGVLQSDPDTAGNAGDIAIAGVTKVVAGGSVTAGDNVQSDATGEAITAASGDYVLGVALSDADDGDIFPIVLVSPHKLA